MKAFVVFIFFLSVFDFSLANQCPTAHQKKNFNSAPDPIQLEARPEAQDLFAESRPYTTEIIFIELRRNGITRPLEVGGRFYHLALAVEDQPGMWVHAYPSIKTQIMSLNEVKSSTFPPGFNVHFFLARFKSERSANSLTLQPYLKLPFDRRFNWADSTKIYCAELVAKVLGLSPRPMYFSPQLWPPEYSELNGRPGSSPDHIYKLLQDRFELFQEI